MKIMAHFNNIINESFVFLKEKFNMKLNHMLYATALVMSFSFSACKKEGCTDALASNYDNTVDKDDQSCTFGSDVLFWYDANQGSFPLEASDLDFYLDTKLLGSSTGELARQGIPTCDSINIVSFPFEMDKTKSGIYFVEVKTKVNPTTVFSDTVNIFAGKCNTIDLGN